MEEPDNTDVNLHHTHFGSLIQALTSGFFVAYGGPK
jgi:hypothetical protein